MIALARLQSLLAAWPGVSVGLVGDLFLDRYLEIDPRLEERSVETGLEAYQVTRVRNSPGALGTVMNNLASLGVGRLVPVTVLGDDGQAYDLLKALRELPADTSSILQDAARLTPTYTKPIERDEGGAWRELNRLDLRNREPLSRQTEDRLMQEVTKVFRATDGLLVVDQVHEEGWGVVAPRVREHLAELSRNQPEKLILIDSRAQIGRFGCGTLKPNASECLAALGRPAPLPAEDRLELARRAAVELAARTGSPLFCTLGARGILVVRPGTPPVEVPGCPVAGPVDTVGAGDSATAGIAASLLAGATSIEAAAVGNLVASVTIQQLGATGTATPHQVLARWREVHGASAAPGA